MKKSLILILILLAVVLGVFGWLVLEAGPANAPTDVRTIELPDTYEK